MKNKQGQAFVVLLVFAAFAITLALATTTVTIINTQTTSELTLGNEALQIAESGAENAILRIIRDPNYTGESLPIGTSTAAITVSINGTARTIQSISTVGSLKRKIQVDGTLANNTFTINSWKEIN